MKRLCGFLTLAAGIAAALSLFTMPIEAQPKPTGYVDRLYVLDGGLGRSNDAGSWMNENEVEVRSGEVDQRVWA